MLQDPSAASLEHNEAPLLAAQRITRDVASVHAASVDARARFPEETISACRQAKLLSAPLPVEMGGAGLGMRALGDIVATMAEGCASSAMVLSMHYNQLACLVRHGRDDAAIAAFLRDLAGSQHLIGSMTSEVGTSGDMRRSMCAVQREDGRFHVEKDATTGSYCKEADVILVTARRDAAAAPNDQVLVMVHRDQRTLTQTTTWDTLGMRGTCSPGYRIDASGAESQICSVPFADIATESMVPFSHILWSALWTGIAVGAYRKAAGFVRQQARQTPGVMPLAASALASLGVGLQAMQHNWQAAACDFDEAVTLGNDAAELGTMRWSLRMNNLKVGTSESAQRLVHGALQVIGISAYKNDGPLSLGRQYRDVLSGALMISNARINAASASLLLVQKAL